MPSGKVNSRVAPVKLRQAFDENEQAIIQYLIHMTSPVSIDTLIALSRASSVDSLNLMEGLLKKKVVYERKEYKRGIYFLDDASIKNFLKNHISEDEMGGIIKRIIDFYAQSLREGGEKTLILAELYRKLKDNGEGIACIKSAADALYFSGDTEKAVAYYDHILESFAKNHPTEGNVEVFLDTVLKKIHILGFPPFGMSSLLIKAEKVAKQYMKWRFLARIEFELTMTLIYAGQSKEAFKHCNDFRKLATKTGSPHMLKMVALAMAHSLFHKGRLSETIRCYEEAIGKQEEFENEEESLKFGTIVGWCHVVCGKISRGMGMIDTIRKKAYSLNLQNTVLCADVLSIHALLEMRRISEAEVILNKVSLPSSGTACDHFMSWTTLECRAYILYTKKDYEGVIECYKKALEHLRFVGWTPITRSWSLEFLCALDSQGFLHDERSADATINNMITGDNIYVKGFAYRYRALRNMEKQLPPTGILTDLRKSEKYLKAAGAEIELARTRIALGNYYLKKGAIKIAQSYLAKAWSFFSTVDKSLFPPDLLAVMPKEQKTEFLMTRIANITESFGTLKDASSFLAKVINMAIDFTMAMRGGFIVIESGKPEIIASRNFDTLFLNTEGFRAIQRIILDASREGIEAVVPGSRGKEIPHDKMLQKAGIDSLICMPAKLDGHIYGYLCLSNRHGSGPFHKDDLPFLRIISGQIAVCLSNIHMYNEMKELKDRFKEEANFYKQEMGSSSLKMIVGQSPGIQNVIGNIRQVAPTDSSVLILGETGVGKELVAKALHELSKRKDGPFIPINLATLPQELVASELFGHEKGSFTGANEKQKGRFELANGGTIFLDEIGDLPPAGQVKLLRVLQEGNFERLGSAKQIHSDFRVIAASNKDLQLEVEKGTFRQDLFFRLNAFSIEVPPLRARKEDIPHLAQHFLGKYNKEMGKRIRQLPANEVKRLLDYHWPGNIRELKHLIERAVILSDGHGISFSGLERSPAKNVSEMDYETMTMADMERSHITKILNLTGWKVGGQSGAAAILGLTRQTLSFRMKKLGIARPSL